MINTPATPSPPRKLALIGGDLRQMVTAKTLASEGYEVAV